MATELPTVMVTGGGGLLGSYLLRELLHQKRKVLALYRNKIPEDMPDSNESGLTWVKGDILDPLLLEDILEPGMQVFHCAGMVSFNPSKKKEMLHVNVSGTGNVVNACLKRNVSKLLHVSSVSAIGRKRDGMIVTEETRWEESANLSNYGRSKYLAEMEVWRGIAEGLQAVIVNPTIVLGTGNWQTGSSALFQNAYRGFRWYTGGVSGFTDAEDVARAMVELMEGSMHSERYIINAENWPYHEVMSAMAAAFGKPPPDLKVTPFISGLIWRWEKLKNSLTGRDPLLTKETAETAMLKVYFDSSKLLKALPGFRYRTLDETIGKYCQEYLVKVGHGAQ